MYSEEGSNADYNINNYRFRKMMWLDESQLFVMMLYNMVSQSAPYGSPGLRKRSSGAPQTKSTNKRLFFRLVGSFSQWQYKCTAHCFQCVQSYFDSMKLISKSMNCERERGDDLFLFEDH